MLVIGDKICTYFCAKLHFKVYLSFHFPQCFHAELRWMDCNSKREFGSKKTNLKYSLDLSNSQY